MKAFLVYVLSTMTYLCIRSIVCVVDVYKASFKIVLYLCVHSLINAIIISTSITIIIMYTCLATFLTTTVFFFNIQN